MKLSVATNFNDQLISGLQGFPVHDLFGKLTADAVGGGRSSYLLNPVSRSRLLNHIKSVHAAGFKFNYLLNSACLDNREYTKHGQGEIRKLLDGLCDMGVDSVTVALPYLLQVIKRSYPKLRVRISVFAQIDTVSKARWWEDAGADALILDSLGVNREFETLKAIRDAVKIDLQLMVNNHCLARCPMAGYHMEVLSHSSQAHHPSNRFVLDHCFLTCTTQKLKQAVDFVRGDWIRPEDLCYYEDLGYEWFKIVERDAPTPVLVNRVRAYAGRRYNGNLLDLVQPFGYKQDGSLGKRAHKGLFYSWKSLLGLYPLKLGFLSRIRKLSQKRGWLQALKSEPIIVDNQKLDGFIERFKTQGCRDVDCDKCRYCHYWASKAVKIDSKFKEECVDEAEGLLLEVEAGTCWR